tara:strand:+ start:4327 stop:5502 length:1176 start_codon:yes stop_codon:yes gene_type:complete
MELLEIQEQLRTDKVDGWLFFDHHHRDPIAYRVLGLSDSGHISRRWYYWIPADGEPHKLVHQIEDWVLDPLPGKKTTYSAWPEQRKSLERLIARAKTIAMQYSPDCMIPYVSLVDGGTIDLIRSMGKHVVSSSALVQHFEARWSEQQLNGHLEAGRRIDQILSESFAEIGRHIVTEGSVEEFTIAEFIRNRFTEEDLHTSDGPIVAVNQNSGNPHYAPTVEQTSPIKANDFVLIDLWAKRNLPHSVYYDITWVGFVGSEPPSDIQNIFEIVCGARDQSIETVRSAIRDGKTLAAFEVDNTARKFIEKRGFGDHFLHRTGHSIGEEVHGNGANIDNLETRDDRPIIPFTCFSIEPGIYLPQFGVRCEIDCYVSPVDAGPTGRVQDKIVEICI